MLHRVSVVTVDVELKHPPGKEARGVYQKEANLKRTNPLNTGCGGGGITNGPSQERSPMLDGIPANSAVQSRSVRLLITQRGSCEQTSRSVITVCQDQRCTMNPAHVYTHTPSSEEMTIKSAKGCLATGCEGPRSTGNMRREITHATY